MISTPPHLIPAKTRAVVHATSICEPDAAELVYDHLTSQYHFPWMFKPSNIEETYRGAYLAVVTDHWESKGRYQVYEPGDVVLVLDRKWNDPGDVTVWRMGGKCSSLFEAWQVRRL